MSVNASEKKLRVKLEREYDLQLVQKQREIESHNLLQSVAKKHKSNVRDDQEKNIQKNDTIKQNKNKQIKKELHQSSFCQRYRNGLLIYGYWGTLSLAYLAYTRFFLDIPIDCYNSGNVCTCLGM